MSRPNTPSLLQQCRGLLRGHLVQKLKRKGVPTEAILARLRSDGASKIDSIRALRYGTQIPLADAKRAVHFSAAWADTKDRDEKLWDDLEASITDLP